MPTSTLEQTNREVAVFLNKIASLFKPECRLTLVVRKPDNPEADYLLSNDDLRETIKACERRISFSENF